MPREKKPTREVRVVHDRVESLAIILAANNRLAHVGMDGATRELLRLYRPWVDEVVFAKA